MTNSLTQNAQNRAAELYTTITGGVATITLNRPQAVNALSHNMIGLLDQALTTLEHDPAVHCVLVTGSGTRGLCAGGDVVALYNSAVANDMPGIEPFFRDEYTLDYRTASYPKPYIAIMQGLVLGGGVGISVGGSHRVVTNSTRLGMPETGIGFSPDVGGTYYLANTPGFLGTYMALTGYHITGADAVYAGLADYYVHDDELDELYQALQHSQNGAEVAAILQAAHTTVEAPLAQHQQWIDTVFSGTTLEEIMAAATAESDNGNEFATHTVRALHKNSPTGMKVALEALHRAQQQSLAETLVQDFRTTLHAVVGTDLVEGIRAQLIDKDRQPKWQPASIDEVSKDLVDKFFQPIPHIRDLVLAQNPTP